MRDGSLPREKIVVLENLFEQASRHSDSRDRKFKIGVGAARLKAFKSAFREIQNLEVIENQKLLPWLLPESEQPDCYIVDTDSAFQEDISLISYNISWGTFGLTPKEGLDWLNRYMAMPDKAERIQALRDLHFEFLSKGIVIPIGFAPYIAVSRKPWRFELSPYYAQTELWRIERD